LIFGVEDAGSKTNVRDQAADAIGAKFAGLYAHPFGRRPLIKQSWQIVFHIRESWTIDGKT
jgi:hypothetical protein